MCAKLNSIQLYLCITLNNLQQTLPPLLSFFENTCPYVNCKRTSLLCPQELIQNADDANATEIVFIRDDRSYGTESLWTQELGEYQGTYENGSKNVKSRVYLNNK